jgi:hypothetical protein
MLNHLVHLALDTAFNLVGQDATYTPSAGTPMALRVTFAERDPGPPALGRVSPVAPSRGPTVRIPCHQLAKPTENAILVLSGSGRRFRIERWDASRDGHSWKVELCEL